MEVIAQDSILVGDVYEEAVRYIAKNGVFRNLKEQLEFTDSSNVLAAFYLESMESSREKLFRIEKKLAGENIQEGTLEQLTFVPQNEVETNSKEFHRIQIRKINQVLTEQDVLDLKIIAEKCPFTEGEVVYKARAMYSELSDSVQVFEDPCVEGSGLKSFLTENSEIQTERNTIAIFPNPAKSEVNILLKQKELPTHIQVLVTDLNGKVVYNNSFVENHDSKSQIHLNVETGMYIIQITNNMNNEYFIEKLLIQK